MVSPTRRELGPMNSGMITPAARMKTAVIAPSAISMIQKQRGGEPEGLAASPCCRSSVKTGTNAADSAALANRLRDEVRDLEGERERRVAGVVPKKRAATISRTGPRSARSPSRSRRSPCCARHGRLRAARRPRAATGVEALKAAIVRRRAVPTAVLAMANIASQKKRILRAERERLENRRHTSAIKTYFRRLEAAVAEGDAEQVADRAPHADLEDRQGGQDRRAAPQHRRPQEVSRGADRARRARVLEPDSMAHALVAASVATVIAATHPHRHGAIIGLIRCW